MGQEAVAVAEIREELRSCVPEIERAFEVMRRCYSAGGKLLLCGNGGSAADCDHWAAELMKSFRLARPLDPGWGETMPTELVSKLQGALPAVPLTGFVAFTTAFANDVDPQLVFAQGVWALGNPGDVLVAISTSGTSPNVCHALRVARAKGMPTVGLTGADGRDVDALADVCIHVPATTVDRVQELHLPVYHLLSTLLEREFFSR